VGVKTRLQMGIIALGASSWLMFARPWTSSGELQGFGGLPVSVTEDAGGPQPQRVGTT